MNQNVNEIIELLEKEAYSDGLLRCADLIDEFKNAFMEQLTVESATDYVGSVILYSRVCAAIKKPWMVFPKLQAAEGALRFLSDFMTDRDTLADSYLSFAESYAYGNYIPEAVRSYMEAARFFETDEKAVEAAYSGFFYQVRFGKSLKADFSFVEERFGKEAVRGLKNDAKKDAEQQILVDPIEASDDFLQCRFEMEEMTDRTISETDNKDTPFFELYWTTKKDVLKKHFGIEWKTPAEMNPNIRFY